MERIAVSQGSSSTVTVYKASSSYPITAPSPLVGLPEFSHLGWGHWFTLRDLEVAVGKKKQREKKRTGRRDGEQRVESEGRGGER
ncbi:unnamed protein product [Prunus armeniaca]|uniref:Uncharacterized protein n=1 Tax=Prunus armeniaca TaxID=36596 RepID=A0A6J5U7F8_PRUAR|nr:unnamed protein product [Prunus armeniaca]